MDAAERQHCVARSVGTLYFIQRSGRYMPMIETIFCFHGTHHAVKARLRPSDVRSVGGPVYPQLIFPLQLETVPQQGLKELRISAVRAHLNTQNLGRIGTAVPTTMPLRFSNMASPKTFQITIEIPLDLYRAQKIEANRQQNGMLQLDCSLDYVAIWKRNASPLRPLPDPIEMSTMVQRIEIVIPQSEWIANILPGLGCNSVRLIEIPMPATTTAIGFEKSVLAVEKAQQRFNLGLYDDAAAQCRIALDPFFDQEKKPDGSGTMLKLKKSWEARLGEATHRWLGEASNAVRWATNPVHHSPSARFDRFEAQMLLMITTTLISYAARTLDTSK